MRINTGLNDERTEKLKHIQSLTQLSVSEIVNPAIDLWRRQQAERPREKLDALLSSGFVGCAEGPEDLASQYKQYLTRNLEVRGL